MTPVRSQKDAHLASTDNTTTQLTQASRNSYELPPHIANDASQLVSTENMVEVTFERLDQTVRLLRSV